MLSIHILLALAWVALTGVTTGANFLAGLFLGYLILLLGNKALDSTMPDRRYLHKLRSVVRLGLRFLWSVFWSNVLMAWTVLTFSKGRLKPGIVAVPLRVRSSAEITLLANWITLTPGTVTLAVSADRQTLYVHTFQIGDGPEAFRKGIRDNFEQHIMEVYR